MNNKIMKVFFIIFLLSGCSVNNLNKPSLENSVTTAQVEEFLKDKKLNMEYSPFEFEINYKSVIYTASYRENNELDINGKIKYDHNNKLSMAYELNLSSKTFDTISVTNKNIRCEITEKVVAYTDRNNNLISFINLNGYKIENENEERVNKKTIVEENISIGSDYIEYLDDLTQIDLGSCSNYINGNVLTVVNSQPDAHSVIDFTFINNELNEILLSLTTAYANMTYKITYKDVGEIYYPADADEYIDLRKK